MAPFHRSGRHGRLRPAHILMLGAAVVLIGSACSKGQSSSTTTTATPPVIKVSVSGFRYHGMPATIKQGYTTFLFSNDESFQITHEMIPIALPSGKTTQDVINDGKAKGPASEDDWLHAGGDFGTADTGAHVLEAIYLYPGNYAVACWQTGTQSGGTNGPVHVSIGMIAPFTVS
ncbi:MAG TPA: hypothetical protein VEM41_13820 [Actinomycetota bacterium]|jgi:hypothetical protein|nr:hypothetical protein [Actinomycetota bacterium]